MNLVLIVCLAFGIAVVSCGEVRDDAVLVQESVIQDDGNFHSRLETGLTKIIQDGHIKHVGSDDTEVVEGEYLFKGDDGKEYDITYTADENGFQPHGDSIPTPPPIPEAIQRSLDYIAQHPYVEREKVTPLKG